jgi:hypothetical protein
MVKQRVDHFFVKHGKSQPAGTSPLGISSILPSTLFLKMRHLLLSTEPGPEIASEKNNARSLLTKHD